MKLFTLTLLFVTTFYTYCSSQSRLPLAKKEAEQIDLSRLDKVINACLSIKLSNNFSGYSSRNQKYAENYDYFLNSELKNLHLNFVEKFKLTETKDNNNKEWIRKNKTKLSAKQLESYMADGLWEPWSDRWVLNGNFLFNKTDGTRPDKATLLAYSKSGDRTKVKVRFSYMPKTHKEAGNGDLPWQGEALFFLSEDERVLEDVIFLEEKKSVKEEYLTAFGEK